MASTQAGMAAATNGTPPRKARGYACVVCQQRKIRCDRIAPCSACRRSNVECVYVVPPAPRRRKRDSAEAILLARLKRYEKLLKEYGAPVDAVDEIDVPRRTEDPQGKRARTPSAADTRSDCAVSPELETGHLIRDRGGTRYLDNTLWAGLSNEIREPDILRDSSEESDLEPVSSDPSRQIFLPDGRLLLGVSSSQLNLTLLHPPPVQIFRLWQTFLENVNPLVKIFHAPSVQQLVLESSASIDRLPRNVEALLFAIYSCAVISLPEEECEAIHGEAKSVLASRFRQAAEEALIRARLLRTSDMMVLQAFLLYLLSIRSSSDPSSFWIMTGASVRICQRVGLHRDGAVVGLPPFEVEMRRRVWQQVVILDAMTAKLAGTGTPSDLFDSDTKAPLNVNDSDLYTAMREPPREHVGATEMMFCLIRNEIGALLRRLPTTGAFDGAWQGLSGPKVPLSEKDRAIDTLERVLQVKFLQYCDPAIPLHFLSATLARVAVLRARLMAHHPRNFPSPATLEQQTQLFLVSLEILTLCNAGRAHPGVQRFMWHVQSQFQIDAFVFLLGELRHRTHGDLADQGWQQIHECFRFHPEMVNDTGNPLHVAVGSFALKAWDARAAGRAVEEEPAYMGLLRAQRRRGGKATLEEVTVGTARMMSGEDGAGVSSNVTKAGSVAAEPLQAAPSSTDTDLSPMDWSYWDELMQGTELFAMDAPLGLGEGGR